MSVAKPLFEQVILPHPAKETLPTMYDLPSEDPEEPGLPDEFHLWQPQLCSETFRPPNYESDRVFVASDLNLYYDPNHTAWYKRPDWFAVVGISRFYQERELRMSYVIWQEEVRPIVAIELLSASTKDQDLGYSERTGEPPTKWEVYEQILAIPYYVTFDRVSNELQIFHLDEGSYQPQTLDNSQFWMPELQLGLGLWFGEYRGLNRLWLRWYDQQGNWIPTDAELERLRAEQERQRAELAQQRAEQERQEKELAQQRAEQEHQRAELAQQRAEQLAERLRQMGINPDEI
ncbi:MULTISPECIES: Uma2 family endonuclease [Moorena]|uniref:Uma2 family endonuclease n=1 Tax=Moorena producens (strain JHB) TaxID=1454205 RepID=A0A1D9G7G5_MOOP1|nr:MULTISPECIES: Uma2 family endonuclease [Moorena]AOY83474.2 Uma2 family endonuclease [Moorena producens JHB]NEP35787.1 Uma2 family endonuclease [Moorena sp. SIO3B2]NEQ17867.1 Uma2 family endonuclease [Moorena sp. SIO3E2]NER89732.1 Uma2 family endonuclease [Moorena sp. SIO3A2]